MGAGGRQLQELPVRVGPKLPTGSPTSMVEQTAPGNQAKLMWLKDVADAITLPEHALDPSNRYAWQRFDQSKFVRKEHFEETLAAAPGDYLKLQAKLEEDGPPTSEAERDRFAVRLKILVRLQALGLMAAHRAVMEGRESATLSSLKGTGKGGANKRSETVAMVLLAADRIRELNEIKASLVDSRSRLRRISSRAIQESRLGVEKTETYLTEIREHITAFQDDDARGRFNYSVQRFAKPDADKRIWPAALRTLADNLVDWRQGQINIVAHMLYSLHEAFPFFAKIDTEDVLQSMSEEEVVARTRAGFTELLEAIDIATIEIGSGDIDAFDLPEALKLTIHDLSPALQNAAHRVIAHHRTVQFWKTMGLTGLQLAIAFVPVVGPFIAAGIGAAQFGADLESMLDKSALVAGSNQPGKGMLGVEGPSSGEWAMMIAIAALTIADLRAGVKIAKEPSAPRPMHELDYELAERRGLFEERAPVGEQGPLEPRVEPSKVARTRAEAPPKPNMRARTRETSGSERGGPKWDTGERTPPGPKEQRLRATGTEQMAGEELPPAVRADPPRLPITSGSPDDLVPQASSRSKEGPKRQENTSPGTQPPFCSGQASRRLSSTKSMDGGKTGKAFTPKPTESPIRTKLSREEELAQIQQHISSGKGERLKTIEPDPETHEILDPAEEFAAKYEPPSIHPSALKRLSRTGTDQAQMLKEVIVPKLRERGLQRKIFSEGDWQALEGELNIRQVPWRRGDGPDVLLVDKRGSPPRVWSLDQARSPDSMHFAEKAAQMENLKNLLPSGWDVKHVGDFHVRGRINSEVILSSKLGSGRTVEEVLRKFGFE